MDKTIAYFINSDTSFKVLLSMSKFKTRAISSAILFITGTTTEFPACLYKCELAWFGNLKLSGNPCTLNVSLGVFKI